MVNWWPGVHTKAAPVRPHRFGWGTPPVGSRPGEASEARAKQLAEVEAEVKRRAAQLGVSWTRVQ